MLYIRNFCICFIVFVFFILGAYAQKPKWLKKACKAQVSVVTYNKNGDILHSGQGFFINESGVALTNYSIFKGAARAVVVDAKNQTYDVEWIEGASSLYDIVKFRVRTDEKTSYLKVSDKMVSQGEKVFFLANPKATSVKYYVDTIKQADSFEKQHFYYTLTTSSDEKFVSSPVLNVAGEVVAMMQMPAKGKNQTMYAVGCSYGESLGIQALSVNDSDLRAIHIKKALPSDAQQASTYIYLLGLQDTTLYSDCIKDYIVKFPNEANGYVLMTEYLLGKGQYSLAEEVYNKGLEIVVAKDEILFSFSKALYVLNQRKSYQPYADWTMERALAEVDRAIALNPLPLYSKHQADCMYALGRYEDACRVYLSLNETNMKSAENYLYASQCKRMLSDDLTEVLALQDSALALFTKPYIKEAAPVLMIRSTTLHEAGKYREAVIDLYDYEHLMRNEVNANFYYHREQIEIKCRMFQQALDDIERACKMQPQEPLFHAEKAAVHYRVGQQEDAIASARKAVELNDEFAAAHRLLGMCLVENNQKAEGLKHLKRAAELGDATATSIMNKSVSVP